MASRASTSRVCMGLMALAAIWSSLPAIEVGSPILASHTPNGSPTDGLCSIPVLSPTGRFTSFSCMAIDVIPGEPGIGDAMLHDAETDSIIGLSYTDQGQWGHCGGAELGTCTSRAVDIAADGGAVVLNSGAPLTADAPRPTPDGGWPHVYLRDTVYQTTEWLTPPVFVPFRTAVARDASLQRNEVLYTTQANETGAPDTNGPFMDDVFIKDWSTGVVELVSVSPLNQQGDGTSGLARFSPDGRYVVFQSNAANLTDDNLHRLYNLFLRDRVLGTTRRLTFPWGGEEFSTQPSFSNDMHITADNRYVIFSALGASFIEGDDPIHGGIYEVDLQTGNTCKIPRTASGELPNAPVGRPALSEDGRFLAFLSSATNLTDEPGPVPAFFVQDRVTGQTINVSAQLGTPPHPLAGRIAISADGSTVAFEWPEWNATYPTLLNNQQIYTVRVRGDPPQTLPTAVPTASRAFLLGLAAMLAFGATMVVLRRG